MGDYTTTQLINNCGYNQAELDTLQGEGFRFYSVEVLEPCECRECKAGRRWFFCLEISSRKIKEYAVIGDGGPSPKALREIEARHPGKVFLH